MGLVGGVTTGSGGKATTGSEGTDASVGATTEGATPSVSLASGCPAGPVSPLPSASLLLLNVFISTSTFSCSKAAMTLSVFFAVVYG